MKQLVRVVLKNKRFLTMHSRKKLFFATVIVQFCNYVPRQTIGLARNKGPGHCGPLRCPIGMEGSSSKKGAVTGAVHL